MRLTRAAQRAQEEAPDALDVKEREPLNEITPNASPEQNHREEEVLKKSTGSKSKKKGASKKGKGKKGKAAEEEPDAPIILEDAQEDANNIEDANVVDVAAEEPTNATVPTPPVEEATTKPVRLTRRQLAMQEEELRQSQRAEVPVVEFQPASDDIVDHPSEPLVEENPGNSDEPITQTKEVENTPQEPATAIQQVHVPESEESQVPHGAQPSNFEVHGETSALGLERNEEQQHDRLPEPESVVPSVEIIEPEQKMLANEKPSDDIMSPVSSRTPSRLTSRSTSRSPMRLEQSIEALDDLEEALERVVSVPSPQRLDGEESPCKTKHSGLNRPLSLRGKPPSTAPKPTKTSLLRTSSVRAAPSKPMKKEPSEPVDYLASKRRPVSMSFPTPPRPAKGRPATKPAFELSSTAVAEKLKRDKEERLKRQAEGIAPKVRPISMPPPPKSTKPPTKAAFELPGEKIAAELKAKKEERLRREAEGVQPSGRPISMPPPPKSTKAPTKPNFELPGEKIAADLKARREERLQRIAEGVVARPVSVAPSAPKSSKPPTKASFELPGAAIAEKLKAQKEERMRRQEEAEAARRAAMAAAAKQRIARVPANHGDRLAPPLQRSSSTASKRSSIQVSRSTSVSSLNKSTVTPTDAAQQKLKGREVFNRDKLEKEARERERREKEEAAKRARAEAAERGRIASREWAEKQKKKMMGL